jgi:stage II sporulation protein GA (sporulation sigma-E factor processing peptidase)
MTQSIYIDVYFEFNFLMDFFIMLILGIVIKTKKNVLRTILSAITGAIYAVLVLVLEMKGGVIYFFTYMVMAEILLLIAFGKQNIKENIKNMIILYTITFLLNGMLNLIYYGFDSNSISVSAKNTYYGKINIFVVLFVGIFVCIIVKYGKDRLMKYIKNLCSLYSVCIYMENHKIQVTALRDTGNSLIEPMTGKPVSIIEKNAIMQLDNEHVKYIFVPYNSVGKQHGLLQAFIADKISVDNVEIEKAVIGVYEGKLSQSNKYEMILNPNLLKKEK